MKRVALILIALAFLTILHAQEAAHTVSRIDSMFAILPTLEGEEKMVAYHQLHGIMYEARDYDAHLRMLNEFLHEARKLGSIKHESYARNDLASIYMNYDKIEEYERRLDDDFAFYRHHRLWEFYFFEKGRYARYLTITNRAEEALELTSQMRQEATEADYPGGLGETAVVTGFIYKNMNNDAAAITAFGEAIDILTGTSDYESLNDAYDYLTQTLLDNRMFDQARQRHTRWGEELTALQKQCNESGIPDAMIFMWRDYYNAGTMLYLELRDPDRAEAFLDLAEALTPELEITLLHTHLTRARLLRLRGQHQAAYNLADKAHRMGLSRGDVNTILQALETKADISSQISGDTHTAALYRELIACNDSIQRIEMNARLDEIRTRYEVDRHIAEKHRNRNYALLAAGSFLLALLALAIWAAYSRRLRRKNLSLVQRIKEHDQLMAARDRQEEELRHYRSQQLHDAPDEVPAEENGLFCKLARLMKDSEVYTNPDLTRKTLADALHTNETYLHNAIREATGLSYAAYLTELRLVHARKLLDKPAQQHTIEAIAIDSGFGSRSTLLRQFRQKFGLSPDEYRKLAAVDS